MVSSSDSFNTDMGLKLATHTHTVIDFRLYLTHEQYVSSTWITFLM